MLKFKNVSGSRVDVWRPAELGGQGVDDGAVLEVDGELVESRPKPKDDQPAAPPLPEDAYIVVRNGEERAWPKAVWDLVTDKPAAKTARAEKE